MKQIFLILFIGSLLSVFAHNNYIYYVLAEEEEYKIKCEIDSLYNQNPNQQLYIYIDENISKQSQKIYVLNRDSNFFGDRSNRKLIISDTIYPIYFSIDYNLGTFSPISKIGKYNERDGTYLKKKLLLENIDPIICSGYNLSNISDILYHSFGIDSTTTVSLDSLNLDLNSDTIYIKFFPKTSKCNDIYVWRKYGELLYNSNRNDSNTFHLSKVDKYLTRNWHLTPRFYNTPRFSNNTLNYPILYRIIFSRGNKYFIDFIKYDNDNNCNLNDRTKK